MANSLTPRLNEIESKLPNMIINGNFDIWQRQITGSLGYVADKWRTSHSGVSASNVSQDKDSDVPYGYGYSAKITCDTTYSVAPSSVLGYMNGMEGYFVRDYIGKEINVSFHVKANHTATYSANLIGNGSQTYVHPFTIDTANTWQKIEFTTTIPNDANWQTENGQSLTILFELLADPNRQTSTVDTWIIDATSNTRGFDSQDNFFDTAGNEIQFSKVMITADPIPDNTYVYAGRNGFPDEFILAQRYFEKTYKQTDYPGDLVSGGMQYYAGNSGSLAASRRPINFRITKRDIPTVTVYSTVSSAAPNTVYIDDTSVVAATSRWISENGGSIGWSTTANSNLQFQWTADADF